MSEKILVTGVTGDVGNEVLQQLAGKGLNLVATARDLTKAQSVVLNGADIVLFDYDRPETFAAALSGVDRIFLVPPPLNPQWHELVTPIIDTAMKIGVKHIVNLSQMGAESIEGLPLRRAELYIERSGIAFTHLRPNWFMQTYNGAQQDSVWGTGGISVPAGEAKASFIDMRDIAAVAVTALTSLDHLNKAYTLTGGEALNHDELVRILSEVTGDTIRYFPITYQEMRENLAAAQLSDEAIEMVIVLYQFMQDRQLEYVSPDVANILGRKPRTFEQFSLDYAESW